MLVAETVYSDAMSTLVQPAVAYWLRRPTKRSASMHTWANAVLEQPINNFRRASDS